MSKQGNREDLFDIIHNYYEKYPIDCCQLLFSMDIQKNRAIWHVDSMIKHPNSVELINQMLEFFLTLKPAEKFLLNEADIGEKMGKSDAVGFALQDTFTEEDVPGSRRCLLRKVCENTELTQEIQDIIDKNFSTAQIFYTVQEESLIGVCLYSTNESAVNSVCEKIIIPKLKQFSGDDAQEVSKELAENLWHYYKICLEKLLFIGFKSEATEAMMQQREQVVKNILECIAMAKPDFLSREISAQQMRALIDKLGWNKKPMSHGYVLINRGYKLSINFTRLFIVIGKKKRFTYHQLMMLMCDDFGVRVTKLIGKNGRKSANIELYQDLVELLGYFQGETTTEIEDDKLVEEEAEQSAVSKLRSKFSTKTRSLGMPIAITQLSEYDEELDPRVVPTKENEVLKRVEDLAAKLGFAHYNKSQTSKAKN